MKTTIDHAVRLVIPKDIRRESGIKPGMPLEVRWGKGAIAITPAPLAVKLEVEGSRKNTPRLAAVDSPIPLDDNRFGALERYAEGPSN
jgi:AbrB family looped-hinge helix DNA binding protein